MISKHTVMTGLLSVLSSVLCCCQLGSWNLAGLQSVKSIPSAILRFTNERLSMSGLTTF